MKIHTDVTTLSRLYPLFKDAGIEGVLTGDYAAIEAYGYSHLFAALLQAGNLPSVCELITRNKTCEAPYSTGSKLWPECSREECMGPIIAFFLDIIGLHNESLELQKQLNALMETSL